MAHNEVTVVTRTYPLLFLALVVGCSSEFRSYDGTLGFIARDPVQGTIPVSYTDEQVVNATEIFSKLEIGCARQLGTTRDRVSVENLEELEGQAPIVWTIRSPIFVQARDDFGLSAVGHHQGADRFILESVQTMLATRTVSGSCALLGAAP